MEVNDGITICRLCLNGNGSLMYIFESKVSRGGVPADVIIELLQFEVSEGDKYPQFVCAECVTKLEDFKQYKERCVTCKELLDQAYASKHIFVSGTGPSGVEGSSDALLTGEPSPLLPNERPHLLVEQPNSWDTLTIKQEEEAVQDSNEDPLACDGYEDIPYSSVFKALGSHEEEAVKEEFQNEIEENNNDGMPSILEWEVVPGKPITESTGEKCVVKGDLKSGVEENVPLYESKDEKSSCMLRYEPENPALESTEEKTAIDEESKEYKDRHISQVPVKRVKGVHKDVPCSQEEEKDSDCSSKLHPNNSRDKFQCDKCKKCYEDVESLSTHLQSHSEQRHSCHKCGKVYMSKRKLTIHLTSHLEKKFKCDICGVGFLQDIFLERHKKLHTNPKDCTSETSRDFFILPQTQDIYCCNECRRTFPILSELGSHVKNHKGSENFPCPVCSEGFSDKCNLHKHIKMHHMDFKEADYNCVDCGLQIINTQIAAKRRNKPYFIRKGCEYSQNESQSNQKIGGVKTKIFECAECGKHYFTWRTYYLHIDMHKFGKRFKCTHCDKYFASNRSLLTHRKAHVDEKHICNMCGKILKNRDSLKLHMVYHGDKNFKCDVCSKEFFVISELNSHKLTHNKELHRCEICGHTFDNVFSYRYHMWRHGKPKDKTKKRVCIVCGWKCRYPNQLRNHMRKHTNERPFRCDECGACFSIKPQLENHITMVHTEPELRPPKVQCDECGKRYTTIACMKRHKKTFHSGLNEFKCQHCGQVFMMKRSLTCHVKREHS